MELAQERMGSTGWQQAIAAAYTCPEELLTDLGLSARDFSLAEVGHFRMRVPRGYAARMRHGDARDPLLLQVLPRGPEAEPVPGFTDDPVGDLASCRRAGLLQKYARRALIVTTGACAVHCRYCFRREFPYQENLPASRFDDVLDAVRRDMSLHEVILSGGDPLSLSDRRLGQLLAGLDSIPHVQRIRLHTRTPIVLPERVDRGLLSILSAVRTPLITVLHANHANEIDGQVMEAIQALGEPSRAVLNQSVLLRHINDDAHALVALSERLFEAGALPYYLHQLDRVAGAAHFAVEDEHARACLRSAAARLPGYLVPRLVREVPGAPAKAPLDP
jgi:EF-P beta-lysylation protein EpmB